MITSVDYIYLVNLNTFFDTFSNDKWYLIRNIHAEYYEGTKVTATKKTGRERPRPTRAHCLRAGLGADF